MAAQSRTLPEPIVQPKVILVEGPDDLRFLGALLRHLDLAADFQLIKTEGKDNLSKMLRILPLVSGFSQVKTLAIIYDADSDPRAAFQALCNSLRAARLSVPRQMGTIVDGNPAVGVFIWPDCNAAGMLETLCLTAVSAEPVMDCVDKYVDCAQKIQGALPQPLDKVRLYAFLASCNRPGLRLGEAAEAGYFPWNSPVFDRLKEFLRAL